jgi:hypothetical protein
MRSQTDLFKPMDDFLNVPGLRRRPHDDNQGLDPFFPYSGTGQKKNQKVSLLVLAA